MILTREPGRWKRAGNRELKMVSEPCGRGAGALSPQRDAPVTASGCKQHLLPQHRGCVRKGAVNQGGTTEVCLCLRPCRASARKDGGIFSCIRSRPRTEWCRAGRCTILIANREGKNYDHSSRFSESFRCGSRSRCPDCLRWFFFHCFFRCCIRQRGILCRS